MPAPLEWEAEVAHVLRETKCSELGQLLPASLKMNSVNPAPPQPGVGYSYKIPMVCWTEEKVD